MASYLDSIVITETESEVTLRELCESISFCVFLRHWGCAECSLLLHRLEPRLKELLNLDIRIIFIGLGSPEGIASFRKKNRFTRQDITIVTDPSLKIQDALGLERGASTVRGPKALVNRAKLSIQGFNNQLGDGDPLQQGGAVLLSATGQELWVHKNAHFGDILDPNQLMVTALKAVAQNL